MHQPTKDNMPSHEAPWSADQLKAAVRSFLDDFSIEATPHTLNEIDSYPEFLTSGTTVYVAHPPKAALTDVVDLACRLQAMGYQAVPHLAVRRIETQIELERALGKLSAAGIDQALVVGGDLPEPVGPFESSMQVLETGLLPMHGFNTIGVAGHPEGSRAVGPSMLRNALNEKVQFAIDTGLRMYIVTQFGFNPGAVAHWELSTSASGIHLPIHVGMAGLVPLKVLLRYALRCGVSASMRMLISRTSALSDQVKMTSMDELILAFAGYRLANPDSRMVRAHFFAFGGAERTARWLKKVLSCDFEIDPTGHAITLNE